MRFSAKCVFFIYVEIIKARSIILKGQIIILEKHRELMKPSPLVAERYYQKDKKLICC